MPANPAMASASEFIKAIKNGERMVVRVNGYLYSIGSLIKSFFVEYPIDDLHFEKRIDNTQSTIVDVYRIKDEKRTNVFEIDFIGDMAYLGWALDSCSDESKQFIGQELVHFRTIKEK
jgi:hypothetical protein